MGKYYDGTKLLSMLDVDGKKPEIYMCTTNRTGGKTTYFGRLCVNRFLKYGEKFCLLYRFNYELSNVADKFFKDLNTLFFPGMEMTATAMGSGAFMELQLDEKPCGYAISLNNADQIKRMSHLFSDVSRIIFDEFQSETNHYCSNEVSKFIGIHTSIARGQGEQVRYVPVYMLSNPVTIINPYYVEMGISSRLQDNTKFLRGQGFVLEQGFVDSASKAQIASGFMRAFSSNKYTAYSAMGVYLNDSKAFISRPKGRAKYLGTLRYYGVDYGLKEYAEIGIVYCDDNADMTHPIKIVVTTDDHNINYVMLKKNDVYLSTLRFLFEKGCFRFKDMRCKEAVLSALAYL